MRVIKNEKTVFCDVDHTLILPVDKNEYPGAEVQVYDSISEKFIKMIAHEPNIRLLIEEKSRGSLIIVWSRGGYTWAEDVLRALKLESYVDYVMTKPMVYIDDLPIQEWLPYRVYLQPDVVYKR